MRPRDARRIRAGHHGSKKERSKRHGHGRLGVRWSARRARLGRRGEMAEKRRRLARMAGQNRGAPPGARRWTSSRGEQTGAMSDGERPLAAARGEESGASSQALDALDVGSGLGPTTRVARTENSVGECHERQRERERREAIRCVFGLGWCLPW